MGGHPVNGRALPEWRQRPERGHLGLLRFMVRLSLWGGRRLSRAVLHGATLYFLLFAPRPRAASRDYLRRALGRPPTRRERYRHLLSFATTVHDRVYLLNGRVELFDVEVQGAEALLRAMDSGGVLLMGAHLGSFEALRCVGRQRPGLQVSMLMYEDNARQMRAALAAINPEARQDVVPLGRPDSMVEAAQRLEQGHLVGMLVDRSLDADDRALHDFLGDPAAFPVAPWRVAAVLRRPVFFMAGLYLGANRYRLVFEPLADFGTVGRGAARDAAIQAARAAYVERLQAACRQAPFNWFNFFDFWQR
ncbi:MAG: acyl-CoA synthetase [Comamonadaceae bacterium]|jgi:predicted LPLAT superfamily acyltransferase|nr:acyl-CoA synthetase [Comamonadaceae bacterium]